MHCFVIVLERQLHDEIPQEEFFYLSDELLAKHVYIIFLGGAALVATQPTLVCTVIVILPGLIANRFLQTLSSCI